MARGQGDSRVRAHAATAVVVVVGLAVTAALTLGARSVHDSNEKRLLNQRSRELGDVLGATIQSLQTPLVSAAEVAEATNASPPRVGKLLAPLAGPKSIFRSGAVWSSNPADPRKAVLVFGRKPALAQSSPRAIRALLARAKKSPQLTVIPAHGKSPQLLEYAVASSKPSRYVVYAEVALPKPGTNLIGNDPAFAGLGYALYLGSAESKESVLFASTADLPLEGRQQSTTIPIGDNHLRLVITSKGELGGALLARLWWLLLIAGAVLVIGAALLTERLVRQRERARVLAAENAQLYAEQRTVAQTLQHSLLPETLPDTPGLAVGARYIAGAADVDIGGDWYDVMQLDSGDVLFVVGDVSGRGLAAGTIMASLRYAIRAYARQGDDPATILTKLADLIDVGDSGHFATVLCGVIDVPRHTVTLANAAHPEPLLVNTDHAEFVSTAVGVPIGVENSKPYESVTLTVPPASMLLAFTDGLVERRGEVLDVGLERLREAAARNHVSVDALLLDLAERLTPDGPADDIAILGVKWKS
jgi:serine phosphatase RsbU (regulator of sigma subunit)